MTAGTETEAGTGHIGSANVEHLALLNQLGQELTLCQGARSGYVQVARKLRETLGFFSASLWSIDRAHGLLVKEALNSAIAPIDAEFLRVDEKLTHWQIKHRVRLLAPRGAERIFPLPAQYPFNVVSLPVFAGDELLAVINLYADRDDLWFFHAASERESGEFFRSVAGMMDVFMRARSLESNTTFYKEIHHRVKNNLQTVASLLRMQIRRLDRISPEQALEDSISRILSIAVVHETLSQGEIGLVDFGDLVGRIAKLAVADSAVRPAITVQLHGARVMLTSKQATSLALIVNELVQNALHHGVSTGAGTRVDVRVDCRDSGVQLIVEDDGRGPPEQFELARHSNLGLTIVQTLTTEELSGEFVFSRNGGVTRASVTFSPHVAELPEEGLD